MHIGHFALANSLFVAPDGWRDGPAVSASCASAWGQAYAVSEMVTSRKDLWNSPKTSRRANHARRSPRPIAVQIAGTEAAA
jgi:tRNA-dihydrouridine synthase B